MPRRPAARRRAGRPACLAACSRARRAATPDHWIFQSIASIGPLRCTGTVTPRSAARSPRVLTGGRGDDGGARGVVDAAVADVETAGAADAQERALHVEVVARARRRPRCAHWRSARRSRSSRPRAPCSRRPASSTARPWPGASPRQVDALDRAVAQLQRRRAGQVGAQRAEAGAAGGQVGRDAAGAFEQILAGHVLEQRVDVDAAGRELDRDGLGARVGAAAGVDAAAPGVARQADDAQRAVVERGFEPGVGDPVLAKCQRAGA